MNADERRMKADDVILSVLAKDLTSHGRQNSSPSTAQNDVLEKFCDLISVHRRASAAKK